MLFNRTQRICLSCLLLFRQQTLNLFPQPLIFQSKSLRHRMLRRQLHRRSPVNRVDTRRKNRNLAFYSLFPTPYSLIDCKVDQSPFAPPDPIPLHGSDLLRPSLQLVESLQQLIRILRNPQKPLRQIPQLDNRVLMPPAAPTDHLLIRQHSLALRTPVHLALLPERQTLLKHLQKEPLVPPVIIRQTSSHLGRPVVAQPHQPHLLLHRDDIPKRPLPRRHPVLQRSILRRQPKRIPPHRTLYPRIHICRASASPIE